MTNAINVTNDLLLIYNTNSADSATVMNYYLAHRPNVGGANVLGIGCPTNEIISSVDFSNQVLAPYANWLTNNPAKRPQYVILFLDMPSRVIDIGIHTWPSVQYMLATNIPGYKPFVTSINMNGTNDCIAYIDKIASLGTLISSNSPLLSASAGGYGNTNWYFDDTRYYYNSPAPSVGSNALSGVLRVNSTASVTYSNAVDSGLVSHITSGYNVAGYMSWGFHSSLGSIYATNGNVQWSGNSGWWIIETVESFNGQRAGDGGNFLMWFSSCAFGGTNYSNTPIGAISSPDEPGAFGVCDTGKFFGLWASGKNFGICAWSLLTTDEFQAVGDPFITK